MNLKFEINKKTNCWECRSIALDSNGYPMLTIYGKQDRAYRHSYTFFNGKIPKDFVVRHTCDNRLCINPEHLILGSHADNVKDRVERNRSAKGINNGRSKLSEKDVLLIFNDDITPKMHLANKFNVDPKAIRDIKNGKTWTYLTSNNKMANEGIV